MEIELLIDHKRCPDCNNRLRRSDWECRHCGNPNLTNWPLTLTMWAVGFFIIIITLLFMISNFCGAEIFQPLMKNYGVTC